jgi:Tol biopolymer transport system component
VPIDSETVDQHGAAWAPDSNAIAYQRLRGGQWELVKAPLGGGPVVHIAEGDPGAGPTAWSPAGDWLAYVRARALHLVSPDGSIDKTVNTPAPVAFMFSHDGTVIYVVRRDDDRNWEMASVDVRTGQQRKTQALQVPKTASVSGISVHPDGRSFITSIGSSRLDLWILEHRTSPIAWWRSVPRLE